MPKLPEAFKALAEPRIAIPLVCLVAVIVLGAVGYLILGDWLVAVIVALFIALAALLVAFWRAAFAREREERLGRGVDDRRSDLDEEPAAGSGAESVHQIVQRAVDDIRNSRLGTAGNDALPWLLVIGDSRSGKSSLLAASGLEVPAVFAHSLGRGPTAHCEWWLTNEAIAIDTSGRYLRGADGNDADEWRTLLGLIRRQRPRLPLNGVILTIDAEDLLTKSASELEELALATRRRLNEIEDLACVSAPVYVVVTHADAIEGFAETAAALSPKQLAEAFGWTNDIREFPDAGERVRAGLAPMLARLEAMVPSLAIREPDPLRRRRLYAFPEELAVALDALETFIATAFGPSTYDEMPFLRGVYLTSALRQGATTSAQLERLGHDWARSDVAGAAPEGGLFTRDLFGEVVLGDEELALPFHGASPGARRLVHIVAAIAFALLATWWGISFAGNLGAIRQLSRTASSAAAGSSSIANLDELRAAIASALGERSVLQTGGLGGTLDLALERAQRTFLWSFGREFEAPAKSRLREVVRGSGDDAFEALAQLAQDVTWLRDAGLAQAATAEPPALSTYAPIGESERPAFDRSYRAFVEWSPMEQRRDRALRESELVASAASRLLNIESLDLWSERTHLYPAITHASLGIPGANDTDAARVTGAYTRAGWTGLVSKLIRAVDATGSSSERVEDFRRAYVGRYDDKWRQFLFGTPMPAVAELDVRSSGYVRLIETIDENTRVDLPRTLPLPPWIGQVREVRREEPRDDQEKEAPWPHYRRLLAQIAADVAGASENPGLALDLARSMGKPGSAFASTLDEARKLVPSDGDAASAARLRAVVGMPILNGASHVLASALRALDDAWQSRIAVRFGGSKLDTQGMIDLYGPDGALSRFLSEDLAPFWGEEGPLPVIADRAMPFSADAREWLASAGNVTRVMRSGTSLALVFEGYPANVRSGDVKVSRRELRMICSSSPAPFVYYEGTPRPARMAWSPDCNTLELRIFVLGRDKREVELSSRLVRRGPFAVPDFLNEARSRGSNRYEWRLRYREPRVEVAVPYRVRGASALRALQHRPPPPSLGSATS